MLRISGLDGRATEGAAHRVAQQLSCQLSPSLSPSLTADQAADAEENAGLASFPDEPYRIMGPVPAPIFRVARRYRWHILIKLALNMSLPGLSGLQRHIPQGIRLSIDVDPLNLS